MLSMLDSTNYHPYPCQILEIRGSQYKCWHSKIQGQGEGEMTLNRARTVEGAPDVINMTFMPIVSLLEGVSRIKHLALAIELYLEFCYLETRKVMNIARTHSLGFSENKKNDPIFVYRSHYNVHG
ncbi:uncharacterized protein LOC121811323 [Salvia splendens]|uniref:uncharacterized protein LOC121811323 n=1 Tax=Salvia splendens TaxID=180675 RepID=UPI001C256567|nr:uncharacterized protein LOC121811323 [Salvia splendens]